MAHHPRPPRPPDRPRRRLPLAVVTSVALVLAGLMSPAAADIAAPGPDADAALTWLDAEIAANGGTMPGFSAGSTDWGLTADAALARSAVGMPDAPVTVDLATELVAAVDGYTTWDGLGTAYAGVRISGALAKVVLVGHLAGLDLSDVGGTDLDADMRALMQTTGDSAGRFSDRNPHAADKSNGFDQAYALMALLAGPGDLPQAGLRFLLAQQCPGGSFRLVYSDTSGCAGDDEANPDATALAVQVLLAVPRTPEVTGALAAALGWLLGAQQGDGSWVGAPPTERANANSTGLAAQALRAAGQPDAADRAASWVTGELQLGSDAAGTPAGADRGAIAYEPARRADVLASGIAAQGRDQWRRATAQGVLALGAGPFLGPVAGEPVNPDPIAPAPTDPAPLAPAEVPAPAEGGSDAASTSQPPYTAPADSDPTGSTTPPSASGPTSQSPTDPGSGGGSSSGTGSNGAASGNDAQLAFSGAEHTMLTASGAAMVLLGVTAVMLSLRMRRPRRQAWHRG